MADRAHPGQRFRQSPFFRADVQNRVLEATESYQEQKKLGTAIPPPGFKVRDSGKLMVKNITGATLAAGSCLQLGAMLLNAATQFNDATPWMEGDTPADPATARFCITREPLNDDKIGEAFGSGVCVALVDVLDTDHTHATPVASATVMNSATSGPCEILSPLSSTGEQLVWVRIGNDGPFAYGGLYLTGGSFPLDATPQRIYFDTAMPCSGVTANTAEGRLTVQRAGVYAFDFNGTMRQSDVALTSQIFCYLYKNGSSLSPWTRDFDIVEDARSYWGLNGIVTLSAGDYLEVYLSYGSSLAVFDNLVTFTVEQRN